ncbi:MarR family transcriptional regulator [Paractinoplanes abujensis]|uniref:DNA-binding MarR family transcriptional regulator n=1 Tax=Paractinoplanes abujensis TaxID=882441 RepID=A0A7W7CUP0_9ACTN|nr:MarR family winged helix-turn-helix transcriptional regulator [Actinoplanes abujensis]MBB4693618.1 DNA-binding MarR family transcriptional regulator [Actinoplanes abujensis]GID21724.1 MarR family transcriptional regulator [Actinoplanes abujensis]
MSTEHSATPDPHDLLGYLLKHVNMQFTALTDAALKHLGIDSKDFGALRVLAGPEPASQLQVAQRLGIDRTTMVAILDTFERQGFVLRRPDPADRRRNIVELTEQGRQTFDAAETAYQEAENMFLAPLDPRAADQLRHTLRDLLK